MSKKNKLKSIDNNLIDDEFDIYEDLKELDLVSVSEDIESINLEELEESDESDSESVKISNSINLLKNKEKTFTKEYVNIDIEDFEKYRFFIFISTH